MPHLLFPGQQTNEKIYLITRPHWIILAKRLVVWLIFLILLFLLDDLTLPVFPILLENEFVPVLRFLGNIYTMFLVAALFSIWVVYYLNFQIVTNERVVDMDQRGLLHHQISELHIADIEDVTAEISGVAGHLFNFGHVHVQTAGQMREFEFDNVPNPHEVAKIIIDLHAKHQGTTKET